MKQKITTIYLLLLAMACLSACGDVKPEVRIGHFALPVPESWKAFSESDRAGARNQFASDLAPGLGQYAKTGAPPPKMGDFIIFQKQPSGQLIGWTLQIPEQSDFMKTMFEKEQVNFTARKNLAGDQIKAGQCRMFKIKDIDVVRVDVEMSDGGKSTNIQYWSPERPGLITVLMVGARAGSTAETQRQFDAIISSIVINKKP